MTKKVDGFTDEEKAAMQERAREAKAEAEGMTDGERDLFANIAEMSEPDRVMAERVHAVIMESAPGLAPRTWYGMPAYSNKDGKVICFFQSAAKFKARYATLGFNDAANLDDGAMWPTAYAVMELTPTVEDQISALVKQAISED